MKKLFLYLCLTTILYSQELYIIANKKFPKDTLTKKEIKALFLKRKSVINGKKILVINYPFNHQDRLCFEKKILQKSRYYLQRYWLKAHYKGQRPPKVIETKKTLFAYLCDVNTALGYVSGKRPKNKDIKVLYQSSCP